MKKLMLMLLAAGAFSFGAASCDSKTENTHEQHAEGVEETTEEATEEMEDAAEETTEEVEQQVDSVQAE